MSKPLNRVAQHFQPPDPPESGPTVRTVGPADVAGGLGCQCGCGVKAMSLRLGPVVMLLNSAALAAELADAIRDAAAETWGDEP